jgi:hypothetical protein
MKKLSNNKFTENDQQHSNKISKKTISQAIDNKKLPKQMALVD